MSNAGLDDRFQGNEIAIVGMAGRFPKAQDLAMFWQNLRNGVEAVTFFSPEELSAAGIAPSMVEDKNYVPARGVLEDMDLFDAAFFGYSPREAEVLDPQHRLFLECAWQALEHAGYDPLTYPGAIGVYGGTGSDTAAYYTYLLAYLLQHPEAMQSFDAFQVMLGNDKDYLATRVAYKLNLRGPAITVQTACSTSLVAVHLACQSLLNGECDLALAGGVSIHANQQSGYYYEEGGIASPDGHCRTFDAQAQGTLSGSGLGCLVLKRLSEAMEDGDTIHAVIRGTACNNDGAAKVGYTAPGVQGQAAVIAEAQSMAGISPESISYIEAHGTATPIGDPIEIAALTRAFRAHTAQKNFCAIGSVKSNMGHLGAAAGMAGLLKTVLALKHQELPPSLHLQEPNPQIDFANSPFYVNTSLAPWKDDRAPRRAGVSSFGIGGTNVHVVLEEAPPLQQTSAPVPPWHLLVLSARSASALTQQRMNLLEHLRAHPEFSIADVAFTLQVGRSRFGHRHVAVCRDLADALQVLEMADPTRLLSSHEEAMQRPVAFLFPGQGSQYVGMGQELYAHEPVFRSIVDRCAELLRPVLQLDIRTLLYPQELVDPERERQLTQTWLTQPVLFVIEYALAKLWESWGIEPQAMIGHSIGEYVAACLAGVFSLETGLQLVAARGRLMYQVPTGAMLALSCTKAAVEQLLAALRAPFAQQLSIAATNAPSQVVVSGPAEAIAALEQLLHEHQMEGRRLHTSHAFHSTMVEPILDLFASQLRSIRLHPPVKRYISNLTGDWITPEQATDPQYWGQHLRHEVRFADGMQLLLSEPGMVFLEVGPGRTLSSLVRQQDQLVGSAAGPIAISSLTRASGEQSELQGLLTALGRLWLSGVVIPWTGFHEQAQRHRLELPTYPFERQRYWIGSPEPAGKNGHQPARPSGAPVKMEIEHWFYLPSWKQAVLPVTQEQKESVQQKMRWLLLLDACGVGAQLAQQLLAEGCDVTTVIPGRHFARTTSSNYSICIQRREDYLTLCSELFARDQSPVQIVHLWNVTAASQSEAQSEALQDVAFYSLLYLAQALGELSQSISVSIAVISNQLQEVIGDEILSPEKALLSGPCKVIPMEYPSIACRSIDIVWSGEENGAASRTAYLAEQIRVECLASAPETVVALRGKYRWIQCFEPVALPPIVDQQTLPLREEGVYLITGGLGGIGLTLAEYLARTVRATLVLISRSRLPEREKWVAWLETHNEQDSLSASIRRVLQCEALGAQVVVISADVTDEEQMQALMTRLYERFGTVHGVIHAAGVAGGGVLQLKTPEMARAVMAPKVRGLRVLEKVLQGRKPDFLLLCSSLSSVRGGAGQIDYSAANAFLDTFACYYLATYGVQTISLDWDTWQEVGMAVDTPQPADLLEQRRKNRRFAILPEEGIEVVQRVLAHRFPQVIVSTVDLQARLASSVPRDSGMVASGQASLEPPPSAAHNRPALTSEFVAPRNDLEAQVASIWGALLGISQIGIYDNFFELGGHSLLATQVVSRLRKELQIEMPLRRFLEKPTIAELVIMITQEAQSMIPVEIIPALNNDAEQLLLATLSDAEVDALLRETLAEE
jgi:acyl transferase domain-containing protein/acyl carrier protein